MSTAAAAGPRGHAPGERRIARARLLVLVWLATTVWTSLVMPGLGLLAEDRPLWVVLGAVGVAAFTVAAGGAVHAAVTPWAPASRRRAWTVALVAASAVSLVLVAPVAGSRWATWAWVGASVVGIAPLLLTWRAVAVAAVLVTAVSAGVAVAVGGSPVHAVVVTGGIGLSVAAVNGAPAWLWALLVDAEAGREAQARLAVGEERLRFARDVHDLLGHSLTVIALKAELVARLEPGDPGVRTEAEEIRRLAGTALAEVREAVHAYRTVDLAAQAASVRQVLEAAGVRCTVVGDPAVLPAPAAARLAPVLREATTNVLRHSRATWCRVQIGVGGGAATLTVANDGAAAAGGDPAGGDAAGADAYASGLDGLADRLADAGGTLRTARDGHEFTLRASVPVADPAPTVAPAPGGAA